MVMGQGHAPSRALSYMQGLGFSELLIDYKIYCHNKAAKAFEIGFRPISNITGNVSSWWII